MSDMYHDVQQSMVGIDGGIKERVQRLPLYIQQDSILTPPAILRTSTCSLSSCFSAPDGIKSGGETILTDQGKDGSCLLHHECDRARDAPLGQTGERFIPFHSVIDCVAHKIKIFPVCVRYLCRENYGERCRGKAVLGAAGYVFSGRPGCRTANRIISQDLATAKSVGRAAVASSHTRLAMRETKYHFRSMSYSSRFHDDANATAPSINRHTI